MKQILKIEELAMFAVGVIAIHILQLPISWWFHILIFLSPDLVMLGYLINTKIGAITYNLLHHKAIAIVVFMAGTWFSNDYVTYAGLMLFTHASFDRIFGYGLKQFAGFKHTHLGIMK